MRDYVNQSRVDSVEHLPSTTVTCPESRPTYPVPKLSPLRLKDVADSIPKYDGQRISVFHFSQTCERALKLISSQQEPFLVQLILNKLQGHVYIAAAGTEYPSVSALLRKLKQIFGPNKSLNQHRGKLGNAYMRQNEIIFDFIARIKELQTAILDCKTTQSGIIDQCTIRNIEHDALDSFVNGLPSDLLVKLKLEGFSNLDDAFSRAIQLSKTLESEAQRKKLPFAPRQPPPPRRDVSLPNPERQDIRPSGPTSYKYSPATPFIKPLIPGQPGPNAKRPCPYHVLLLQNPRPYDGKLS